MSPGDCYSIALPDAPECSGRGGRETILTATFDPVWRGSWRCTSPSEGRTPRGRA